MKAAIYLSLVAVATCAGQAQAGGDPQAGKEKSAVCAGCHGADGNSVIGANPRLAGQYESYLFQALQQYKSGRRKDMLMGNMVANLSNQDMRDLAAWFSSQETNVLEVLPNE
ncbi:MAG: cytochrome c [Chromatiaceae bacterium]|nr:cytochrome c [Chromatiaceae bacterium]MCP5315754.1 cytochrome c [Chromatiaceae bacterium]